MVRIIISFRYEFFMALRGSDTGLISVAYKLREFEIILQGF